MLNAPIRIQIGVVVVRHIFFTTEIEDLAPKQSLNICAPPKSSQTIEMIKFCVQKPKHRGRKFRRSA
jgi:hypothetical protein